MPSRTMTCHVLVFPLFLSLSLARVSEDMSSFLFYPFIWHLFREFCLRSRRRRVVESFTNCRLCSTSTDTMRNSSTHTSPEKQPMKIYRSVTDHDASADADHSQKNDRALSTTSMYGRDSRYVTPRARERERTWADGSDAVHLPVAIVSRFSCRHQDDMIVTPFAQLLASLKNVRKNFVDLTHIPPDR